MSFTDLESKAAPIRLWGDVDSVEPQALGQLHNIARLPWVHGVAVMPDVHYGIGATVGSVIAMRGAVSPAAVGVDIGCGMTAQRTSLTAEDLPDDLGRLRSAIEAAIPVGQAMHKSSVDTGHVKTGLHGWHEFWSGFDDLAPQVARRAEAKAMKQLGTLGSGNHYIEICLSDEAKSG